MLTYLGLALIVAAAYATTRLTAPRHRAAAFAAIVVGVVLGAAGLLARFDDPHNLAHWIIGGTVTVLAAIIAAAGTRVAIHLARTATSDRA
ncbi:hypothetical protein [Rhodococcoides corynebacterioides]|uniref:hypothetical protein n=1 Tax=Rhodococcoides corynebacterioides TaxID=53972 RepID=UPI003AEA951D